MPSPSPSPRALLIDTAEWFHDVRWTASVSRRQWRRLPSRTGAAVDRALAALDRCGSTATFAVLGEAAARDPGLVRRIVAAGHHVASSGWTPGDLAHATAEQFGADLVRTRAALVDGTGVEVDGFCAPWPVSAVAARWLPTALRATGHTYDASAFGDREDRLATVLAEGTTFAVRVVRAAELDGDQPVLRGLPKPLQRTHAEAIAATSRSFPLWLAAGPAASIETCLALPRRAAMRAAATAPVGSPAVATRAGDATPLTLVVPLKDEEEGVAALWTDLELLCAACPQVAFTFVFVDDGSTDQTWQRLQELVGRRGDVRLCRHEHNRGVAAAIQTGIRAAETELVASIDGDLSYDPVELWPMLQQLGSADLVTASPYHPRGGVRNVPAWRFLLSRTLSRGYRMLLRSDVHTWTSCCRVYRRSSVADLPLDYPGFLGTAELLVRLLRRGGRVVEHPCVLETRLFGVSKLKVLRTVGAHLGLLWQVARGAIR